VGSSIWQTIGWSSIIYIATLSTVDPNLYDAAAIDGAGRIGRIIHISLPALVPVITVQFIMRIGNILSVGFEKVILLYNSLTYETADVISSYVYRFGLEEANYSFGTAVGIFNSMVNITVLVTVNWLFRRFSEESLW
jgi:putative aldouronate transport system permease protein